MFNNLILWGVFAAVVVGFLLYDLMGPDRHDHTVSVKSATKQTLLWIGLTVVYGGLIWYLNGASQASDFMAAYVMEKALSMDNLFVMMMIFGYFNVTDAQRHRVLYWGIMGAIVFRAIFVLGGVALVSKFHVMLYILAMVLIWNGVKLLSKKGDDEGFNGQDSKVIKFVEKVLPIDFLADPVSFRNGKKFTLLFVALVVVEVSDIIFAIDSVPAVLSITQNPLIAFTSNIFAIFGLRALFFLIEGVMAKLKYVSYGLATVLIFIGVKMLLPIIHMEISSVMSLIVIAAILTTSIVASLFSKN